MAARISSLEALSASIIRRVQPVHDGGIVQFIESKDPILRRGGSGSSYFTDFIKKCNAEKGTYELSLIAGSAWALLIPFFVTGFLFLLCCCKCRSRCKTRTKACLSFSNLLARYFSSEQGGKAKLAGLIPCCRPIARIRMPNDPRGRVLKALCVVVSVFLALFASSIALSFVADTPVRAALNEPSATSSIRGIANRTLDAFERFVVRAVWEGRNTTTIVIKDFTDELQHLIRMAVGNFTDNLMLDYGVKTLFVTAERVITDIENVLAAMSFIKQSQNNIFVRYHEFNGFVNTYRDLLQNLGKVCNLAMSDSLRQECRRLDSQRLKLEVSIQQSKINFDSSTSLLFILKEMKVNISELADGMQKAKTGLDDQLSKVYVSIQKDFNLNAIFGTLDKYWEIAINATNHTLLMPLSNLRNGTVYESITISSSVWKVVIGLCNYFMFLVIIVSICFLLMVFSKWSSGSNRQQNYVDETLRSNESDTELLKLERSHSVPVRPFAYFGIFCGFFILVPAAVVVLSFYSSSLVENEVCRYTKSDGLSQIDILLDSYIDSRWAFITDPLTEINLQGISLNLKAPQGILTAITGPCVNDSQRLMQAVNFTDILDVKKLLHSPMVTDMLEIAKNFTKKTIGKIDASKMIPTSYTKILREAVNLTNMMVDQVDYENSIKELRKPLLKLDNYPKFVSDLKTFTESLLPSHKDNDELRFIVKLIATMQGRVEEYRTLSDLLGQVRTNFEVLNNTRRIGSGLNQLIGEFDAVLVILLDNNRMVSSVDPIFDGVMSWAVPEIGNSAISSIKKLERQLLPCDDLAEAFNTVTKGVCEDILPPLNAFTMTFGWCVVCFQLLFLSLCLLLRKVRRQQTQKDSSDC